MLNNHDINYSSEQPNLNDFHSQTNDNLNYCNKNYNYSTFIENNNNTNNINNNTFNTNTNNNIIRNIEHSKEDSEHFAYVETNESESEKMFLIDKIINEYGYKWQTIKAFLCSFMLLFLSGYFNSNPLNYYFVIRTKMNLSENYMIFLFSLSITCKSIGGFFCGVILSNKIITRKNLIYVCISLMLLLNILLTVKYELKIYFAFIIFGCFAAGILDILAIHILCETLPIFLRGTFICLVLLGYLCSDLFNNFLVNSFSDKNNINVRAALIIISVIYLIYLFLFLCLPLSDSARNLLMGDEYKQAFVILQKLKESDLTVEEQARLMREAEYINKVNENTDYEKEEITEDEINFVKIEKRLEENSNNNNSYSIAKITIQANKKQSYFNSLKLIFSKEYIKTTLIFFTIRFLLNFTLSGITNTVVLYLSKVIDESDIKKISGAQLFINLISMLSFPLSASLIEIKFLGRKSALMLMSGLSLIVLTLLLFLHKFFHLLGVFFMFFFANIFIIVTLTSETYPTSHRDNALGMLNIIEAFGSVLGITTYVLLIQKFILSPFIISLTLISVCFVMFFFIENETKGKALDFILKQEELINYFSKENEKDECKDNEQYRRVIYSN